MEFQKNVNLAPYTTLKIGGPAKFFCEPGNVEDIREAVTFAQGRNLPVFVLGGGSNVVVGDKGFPGLVIHPLLKGIKILHSFLPAGKKEIAALTESEDSVDVWVQLGAGENWDEVVKFAVGRDLWGIENLSHIPGSCGAIAVQNIGAYGQEISQVIESVEALSLDTSKTINFSNAACRFAYRQSIFNSTHKGNYIILSTTIRLSKQPQPNLSYRDLKQWFADKQPSLGTIRQAVIQIRNAKFPFPTEAKNGNVGSFFKNPFLSATQYQQVFIQVSKSFGDAAGALLESKALPQGDGCIKIPAAFLLDICGLKNISVGGAGINYRQPLIIINKTGSATAANIIGLAKTIQQTVFAKTGVLLKVEPEFINLNAEGLK